MISMKSMATRIFWALLLIASVPSAVAGVAAVPLPTPPKSFSARFIETRTLPGFNQPLVSRGQVAFSRVRGVLWEVTAPYHYVFKMGPSGVEEQLPDGSVRRLDAEHAPWLAVVRHIFISALTGDTSDLEHYFDVRITALKVGRRIELSPKPGPMAKAIKHISVIEAGTPQFLRIDEASGGRIDIHFLDTRITAEAP